MSLMQGIPLPLTLSDGTKVVVMGATNFDSFVAQMELGRGRPAADVRDLWDGLPPVTILQQFLGPTRPEPVDLRRCDH